MVSSGTDRAPLCPAIASSAAAPAHHFAAQADRAKEQCFTIQSPQTPATGYSPINAQKCTEVIPHTAARAEP